MSILLYIPNLHKGVLNFFSKYSEEHPDLYIIGEDLAGEFFSLHTEIRAINPFLVAKMLKSLAIFSDVFVLNLKNIGTTQIPEIVTATETISKQVVEKYFPLSRVTYDTTFLRYDEGNVKSLKPVIFDRESSDPFDLKMMSLAYNESEKSSCWWRHVGSVLVRYGVVLIVTHNQHVPSEHMPYVLGDPRDFIEAGQLSHFASSLHSEDGAILEALKREIKICGADIYVSVFPCPRCAKMIAYSGIKRCFFGSGHASLDGQEVMKANGVELIYVPIVPQA